MFITKEISFIDYKTIKPGIRFFTDYIYDAAINTKKVKYLLNNPIDRDGEYALVLLKPGRFAGSLNVNLTKQNIYRIFQLVYETNWVPNNIIVYDGSKVTDAMLKNHYPQFWMGVGHNIMNVLYEHDKINLEKIYGKESLDYKIYHAVDLINKGISAKDIADFWSKRRNGDHSVLEKINLLNEGDEKCPVWGPKRVLLVDKKMRRKINGRLLKDIFVDIPEDKFFIYNGHVSHMLERFKRPGEKIFVALFRRGFDSKYDHSDFREYVVKHVREDFARNRFANNERLKELLDGEETFVHCTDPSAKGINHSWREIRTWLPDKEVDEISDFFRPERGQDISKEVFLDWMDNYRKGKFSINNKQRRRPFDNLENPRFANKNDVLAFDKLESRKYKKRGKLLIVRGDVERLLPIAGTGGRLFGYDQPEETRIKALAPLLKYNGKDISVLEARLRYLKKEKIKIPLSIMTNDKNFEHIKKEVLKIAEKVGYSKRLINFYFQAGLPRFNPEMFDLRNSEKFQKELAKKLENTKDNDYFSRIAYKIISRNGTPGDYFRDNEGNIMTKAPGSISGITSFIINGQLERVLRAGKSIFVLSNGEDLGAVIDPVKVGFLDQSNFEAVVVVTDSLGDRGSIIKDQFSNRYIVQAEQLPRSLSDQDPILANVNNIYIKTNAILRLLNVTAKEFLALNKYQILELVQDKIIKKLAPSVEVKPVPVGEDAVRFCGQFTLADEDVVNMFSKGFVYEKRENSIYQFKSEDDLESINNRIAALLSNAYKVNIDDKEVVVKLNKKNLVTVSINGERLLESEPRALRKSLQSFSNILSAKQRRLIYNIYLSLNKLRF